MALNNNFYNEIFENEKYWTELASKKLLNIYYFNGKNGIREFYIKKRLELDKEYQVTQNPIQGQFLNNIINIIKKIETLTREYREGKNININSLVDLFLYNQMNNNLTNDSGQKISQNSNNDSIAMKKRILENLKNMYISSNDLSNDVYDDFDFDQNKKVA